MFSACCCSWLWVLNFDSFVTPSTSWATSGAEALLDVGQAVLGVLRDVVEERGLDRDRVDPELGEDLGRGDRMRDVRLAGRASLALVRVDGEIERLADGFEVAAGVLGEDRGVEGGAGAPRDPGPSGRADPCARRRGALARPAVGAGGRLAVGFGGAGSWSPSAARIRLSRSRPGAAPPRPPSRSFQGRGPSGPMIGRSWPLPASRTMSPGRARSKAASIAARRSAMSSRSWSRRLPAASAPRAISSRMASRSSPRGSSSVTTTIRARSPAIRPISGRLAVSRSPADPKTAIRPPPRDAADRREQVEHRLERRRAVCEVDDDPERLAELDPLHPAGHDRRPSRGPRGPRPGRGRPPRRARRPPARCGR